MSEGDQTPPKKKSIFQKFRHGSFGKKRDVSPNTSYNVKLGASSFLDPVALNMEHELMREAAVDELHRSRVRRKSGTQIQLSSSGHAVDFYDDAFESKPKPSRSYSTTHVGKKTIYNNGRRRSLDSLCSMSMFKISNIEGRLEKLVDESRNNVEGIENLIAEGILPTRAFSSQPYSETYKGYEDVKNYLERRYDKRSGILKRDPLEQKIVKQMETLLGANDVMKDKYEEGQRRSIEEMLLMLHDPVFLRPQKRKIKKKGSIASQLEGDDGEVIDFSNYRSDQGTWASIPDRGFIRLYLLDNRRFSTFTASLSSSTDDVLELAFKKFHVPQDERHTYALHLQCQSGSLTVTRQLKSYEKPLILQQQWHIDLGYDEEDDIQLAGRYDFSRHFRFLVSNQETNKQRDLSYVIDEFLAMPSLQEQKQEMIKKNKLQQQATIEDQINKLEEHIMIHEKQLNLEKELESIERHIEYQAQNHQPAQSAKFEELKQRLQQQQELLQQKLKSRKEEIDELQEGLIIQQQLEEKQRLEELEREDDSFGSTMALEEVSQQQQQQQQEQQQQQKEEQEQQGVVVEKDQDEEDENQRGGKYDEREERDRQQGQQQHDYEGQEQDQQIEYGEQSQPQPQQEQEQQIEDNLKSSNSSFHSKLSVHSSGRGHSTSLPSALASSLYSTPNDTDLNGTVDQSEVLNIYNQGLGFSNDHLMCQWFKKEKQVHLWNYRVKKINLRSNYLEDLPAFTAFFPNLRAVDLSNNCFTSLKGLEKSTNFKHVRRLDLSNNKLKKLDVDFQMLPRLQCLCLSDNALTKLSPSIVKLKSLEWLDIRNNQLSSIDKQILELPKLKYLNLSYNQLHSLPDFTPLCPRIIRADGNQLTSLRTFERLQQAGVGVDSNENVNIVITPNETSGQATPVPFNNSDSTASLVSSPYLFNSKNFPTTHSSIALQSISTILSAPTPPPTTTTTALTSSSSSSSLPSSSTSTSTSTSVAATATATATTAALPSATTTTPETIEVLAQTTNTPLSPMRPKPSSTLASSSISNSASIAPSSIASLPLPQSSSLNPLTTITAATETTTEETTTEETTTSSAPSSVTPSATTSHMITSPSMVSGLLGLYEESSSSTRKSNLSASASASSALTKASSESIPTVGGALSLPGLRVLSIKSNYVSVANISQLSTLCKLDMSKNELISLPDDLGALSNLQTLILDVNKLTSLPQSFSELTQLEYFSAKANELYSLPDMSNLRKLKFVNISINSITHLPDHLMSLPELLVLNASSNHLQRLPPIERPECIDSTVDDLNNASQTAVNRPKKRKQSQGKGFFRINKGKPLSGQESQKSAAFGASASPPENFTLEELYLGDNKLNKDCIGNCLNELRSLKILYLNDNSISELDHCCNLTQLEVLNLNTNGLLDISQDLCALTALKDLKLANNKLCSLPSGLSCLTNLEFLDLAENNLRLKLASGIWSLMDFTQLCYLDLSFNKYLGMEDFPGEFLFYPNLKLLNLNKVILPCKCKEEAKPNNASSSYVCKMCLGVSINIKNALRVDPSFDNVCLNQSRARFDARCSMEGPVRRNSKLGLDKAEKKKSSNWFIDPFTDDSNAFKNDIEAGYAEQWAFVKPEMYNICNGNFLVPEDGHITSTQPCHRIFCIFDGFLGNQVSNYVGDNFISTWWGEITHLYDKVDIDNNLLRSLRRTFLTVNRSLANQKPLLGRLSGCSAVVCCINRDKLFTANCGTAIAVLCRNGKAVNLSTKHSPKWIKEHERVISRGGYVDEDHKVFGISRESRCFGSFFLQPYVNSAASARELTLTEEDEFIILGCNGLWSYISPQVAVNMIRKEHDAQRAASRLRDFASMYGSRENISVQVIFTPKRKREAKDVIISHPSIDPFQEEEIVAPVGRVTLVFTDIKNSTVLWENLTNDMRESVQMHNNLLRRLLNAHRGYEVKTEGDAFMVAFSSSYDALCWCLDVQTKLLQLNWSNDILQHPDCAEITDATNSKVLFCGLSVRMGIHSGCPDCLVDPVTKRMDYFGPMVNRSARMSAVAKGGQIVLSDAVKEEVEKELNGEAIISILGDFRLKGLADKVKIWQAVRSDVKERMHHFDNST